MSRDYASDTDGAKLQMYSDAAAKATCKRPINDVKRVIEILTCIADSAHGRGGCVGTVVCRQAPQRTRSPERTAVGACAECNSRQPELVPVKVSRPSLGPIARTWLPCDKAREFGSSLLAPETDMKSVSRTCSQCVGPAWMRFFARYSRASDCFAHALMSCIM